MTQRFKKLLPVKLTTDELAVRRDELVAEVQERAAVEQAKKDAATACVICGNAFTPGVNAHSRKHCYRWGCSVERRRRIERSGDGAKGGTCAVCEHPGSTCKEAAA